jgi:hypothetical protein
MRRPLAAVGVAFLLCACLLAGTGLGAGGDRSVLLYPEAENRTVAPGDSVEVDVVVSYHGTASGDGLESVSLVAEYNESLLRVTDVEPAGWFADGTGNVATASETDGQGVVTLSQELDPPGDGVVGTAQFATLTVEAAPDAPPGTATIAFGESNVAAAGGFPLPVFETDPEIRIDPDAESAPDSDDTSAPPAPTALAVVSVVAGLALVAVARRRRSE